MVEASPSEKVDGVYVCTAASEESTITVNSQGEILVSVSDSLDGYFCLSCRNWGADDSIPAYFKQSEAFRIVVESCANI